MARSAPATTISTTLALLGVLGCALSACERVTYWSGPTETDDVEQVVATSGQTSAESSGAGATVDEAAVLAGAAACATELYGELAAATGALATAAATSADSGSADDREAARDAWRAAMDVWQEAEALRVGPIGPDALPGGDGARDEIYVWPLTNRCLVEQTIVSRAYLDPDFGALSLANVRGLGADEYLLFYDGTDNDCAPTTSINSTGAWAALDDDELAARKRDYADVVATALDARARQVDATWRSDGGGFADDFAASGTAGASYASSSAALQALFAGMVVVTRQLRDDKLGAPLDADACGDAGCDAIEAPFARASATLARGALSGVARVYRGCAAGGGVGFDDLLLGAGRDDVAARVASALDAAITALDAIDGPDLAVSIEEDRPRVEAARSALAGLAGALEEDAAPALQLDASAR